MTRWKTNAVIAAALAGVCLAFSPRAADAQGAGAWAVLVRNADTRQGQPPFALVDEYGEVRRYVEPTPGVDLSHRVGEKVRIEHDTGETLLASQLVFSDGLRRLSPPRRDAPTDGRPAEFRRPRPRGRVAAADHLTPIGTPRAAPAATRDAWASASPRRRVVATQFEDEGDSVEILPIDEGSPEPIVLEDLLAEEAEALPEGAEVLPPIAESEYFEPNPTQSDYPPYEGAAPTVPAMSGAPPYQCATCREGRRSGRWTDGWNCPLVGGCGLGDCGLGRCLGLGGSDCGECVERQRTFVFADALFLRASGGDVAYAQQQNGLGPPGSGAAGTTPFGRIGVVDHDYDVGVRFGVGRGLDACSDLVATFSHFETDGADAIGINPGGALGSLVQHPGAEITASTGPANASASVEFQIVDLLYRRSFKRSCNGELSYLLGLQFGHLDQAFAQQGIFTAGTAGTIDTQVSDVSFDGGGLKVGVDGQRRLSRSLSLYGRLTAAAMSGQFDTSYASANTSTGVDLAIVRWQEDRVVSQVEYELGVGWTSPKGRWHASAGYLFSHWGNVVTPPTLIDAVQADNYTDIDDTLTFDGAVGRIQYSW